MATKAKVTKMFFDLTANDEGEPAEVIIPGLPGVEEVLIGANGVDLPLVKSAMGAITGFFRHGDYNHPDTEPGLHLFTSPVNNALLRTIGYVHCEYRGEQDVPVPTRENYPLGWAPLIIRDGYITLGRFKKTEQERIDRTPYGETMHAWNVANKHLVIDQFVKGVPVRVRIAPARKLFDSQLAIWTELDDAVAREMSNTKYFAKANYNRVVKAGYQAGKRAEAGTAPDNAPAGDAILMRIAGADGETVDMNTLPPKSYPCCDHRAGAPFRLIRWRADSTAIRNQWQRMAEAKWKVDISE